MIRAMKNLLQAGVLAGALMTISPMTTFAAIGPGFTTGTYVATITADQVNITAGSDGATVLGNAQNGDSFEVLEDLGNGTLKIQYMDQEAYLTDADGVSVSRAEEGQMEEIQKEALESSASYKRQQIVDFALQFVGGPYRYGGSNPVSGTDCSGFTSYILKNAAGITMNRSSGGQAAQGKSISADQMQPGDLLFYSNGSRINHVAMYIGNGQIVHASTPQSGITISKWNYRTPVKITSVLG